MKTVWYLIILLLALSYASRGNWKRQPCGATVGSADIVTRWGATVDPSKQVPLSEYPRPQLVRGGASNWLNLNGLWEWAPATQGTSPPFGRELNRSILVPFPVESCLSGIRESHQHSYYRLVFDAPAHLQHGESTGRRVLLHFGAVDWRSHVYLNKRLLGTHTGGYDSFSFEVNGLARTDNELIVAVYDPSERGGQPFGKQRQASIAYPGTDGEKYTPTSGIWQTVWLESVPEQFISEMTTITANLTHVSADVVINHGRSIFGESGAHITFAVEAAPGKIVAQGSANVVTAGTASLEVRIPEPQLWSPASPFLYNLTVNLHATDFGDSQQATDSVRAYFGMRTVSLSAPGGPRSLMLNGKPFFASGWLDQSWWPDGQYTAPSDEALAFDVHALKTYGMNMVRLHQKINPDRWYYHADRAGVVVLQDAVQHFNYHADKSGETQNNLPLNATLFTADWAAAIRGRRNHPCIIQWNIFNEFEYEPSHFPCSNRSCPILETTLALDPSRLVDFNSGGPGNALGVGDVNDIHSYPNPRTDKAAATQTRYGMVGEYGGIGWSSPGHEWLPGQCQRRSAGNFNSSADGAKVLLRELMLIAEGKAAGNLSAVVYTQITDVELECDGILTYDRIPHYSDTDVAAIRDANLALTTGNA